MTTDGQAPTDVLESLRAAVGAQYTVERLLGQGGMGSVYLGRDVTLDRPVAIKVINPDVASDATVRDRFLQEARTVAKLRHPNIVSVYAAGESAGLLYFVMEFVPGESLRELTAREGRITGERAERILCEVALALDSAHAQGMVHRDVKPENILIDKDSGRALLTDFGVARAFEKDGGLTQAGMILGSPRYMSPEQASGDRIDGRSDLYSLALVGYELYTGVPVVQSGSAASMLVKQLTVTPPPLAEQARDIPPHVADVIDRGLAKDPAQRWQSGKAFADAIAGNVDASSGGVSGAARSRAMPRKRNWLLVALPVAAVAGVALWLTMLRGGPVGRAYLVAPFEIQSGDQSIGWLHDASVNMLTLTLGQWGDLQVVDYERTLSLLDKAGLGTKARLSLDDAFALARRAKAGTVVTGQIQTIHDSLIVVAKLYDVRSGTSRNQAQDAIAMGADPRPLFDRLAQKLLQIAGGPTSSMQLAQVTTSSLEAYRAYLGGLKLLNAWDLKGADTAFARAIDIDSTFTLAYYKRSLSLGWSDGTNRPEFLQAADRAFASQNRLPPRERALVSGQYHIAHALAAQGAGDTVKAAAEFTASIKSYADLFARGDTLVAEAWYGQADAYYHGRLLPGVRMKELVDYTTRSLRGFNKTLAIDSTFHLAYSHLVQLYNSAASNSNILISGDSAFGVAEESDLRRIGGPVGLRKFRDSAGARGIAIARAWTQADAHTAIPVAQLAQSYYANRQPDSAIAVLRSALARRVSDAPMVRVSLLAFQQATADTGAATNVRYILDHFTRDSMREIPASQRIASEADLMTQSAVAGRSADVDRAGKLFIATDSFLPGTRTPSSLLVMSSTSTLAMAMGEPMSEGQKRGMLTGLAALDNLPEPLRTQARSGSLAVPYIAYLTSRDTAFIPYATSWAGTKYPELDALVALSRGDSNTARKIAQTFPSLDTLKIARFALAGLRSFARAEVLIGLGLTRQAAETYEATEPARFTKTSLTEPGYVVWVRTLLARARLWKQLGERDKAVAAYEEFIRRWANADGVAAKQVSEAKQELAQLRDAPRKQ